MCVLCTLLQQVAAWICSQSGRQQQHPMIEEECGRVAEELECNEKGGSRLLPHIGAPAPTMHCAQVECILDCPFLLYNPAPPQARLLARLPRTVISL